MGSNKRGGVWVLCVLLLFSGCTSHDTAPMVEPPVNTTVSVEGTPSTITHYSAPVPVEFHLKGVPMIPQHPLYPTGCESAAAVMALQWAGEAVTMAEFVDEYLLKDRKFYYEDGVRHGPDPWEVFAGDPRTTSSYGCMSPVIRQAMIRVLGGTERVKDVSGSSMTDLCEQYVAQGVPVMVWVSINMLEVYPADSWVTPRGDTHVWLANEHTMLLVGYDEEYYYFNDPYKGCEVRYLRALSESRYEALGKQALAVIRNPLS